MLTVSMGIITCSTWCLRGVSTLGCSTATGIISTTSVAASAVTEPAIMFKASTTGATG